MQDPDGLTATEAQVARLVASGLSNREIAAAAFITHADVSKPTHASVFIIESLAEDLGAGGPFRSASSPGSTP